MVSGRCVQLARHWESLNRPDTWQSKDTILQQQKVRTDSHASVRCYTKLLDSHRGVGCGVGERVSEPASNDGAKNSAA